MLRAKNGEKAGQHKSDDEKAAQKNNVPWKNRGVWARCIRYNNVPGKVRGRQGTVLFRVLLARQTTI